MKITDSVESISALVLVRNHLEALGQNRNRSNPNEYKQIREFIRQADKVIIESCIGEVDEGIHLSDVSRNYITVSPTVRVMEDDSDDDSVLEYDHETIAELQTKMRQYKTSKIAEDSEVDDLVKIDEITEPINVDEKKASKKTTKKSTKKKFSKKKASNKKSKSDEQKELDEIAKKVEAAKKEVATRKESTGTGTFSPIHHVEE